MLDIMYEIPKDDNIGMVTITKAYVEKKGKVYLFGFSPQFTLSGQRACVPLATEGTVTK